MEKSNAQPEQLIGPWKNIRVHSIPKGNGGFTNEFTLVNTGSFSSSVTLSFFGNDGSPLSMSLFLPQTGENLSGSTMIGHSLRDIRLTGSFEVVE